MFNCRQSVLFSMLYSSSSLPLRYEKFQFFVFYFYFFIAAQNRIKKNKLLWLIYMILSKLVETILVLLGQ